MDKTSLSEHKHVVNFNECIVDFKSPKKICQDLEVLANPDKFDALYDWDQFDPSKRVLSVSLFHNIGFPLWKSFEQIPKYVPPKF